jgi:hypothetical protein
VVKACRKACANEYFTEEPLVLPDPPKDADLGKSPDNPAETCIDVKMNGGKPFNDAYHMKKG